MTKYEILKEYEDNLMNLEDTLSPNSTDNTQLNTISIFFVIDLKVYIQLINLVLNI